MELFIPACTCSSLIFFFLPTNQFFGRVFFQAPKLRNGSEKIVVNLYRRSTRRCEGVRKTCRSENAFSQKAVYLGASVVARVTLPGLCLRTVLAVHREGYIVVPGIYFRWMHEMLQL